MFTALLVDDEHSVLEALVREIGWAGFGIDQVLTAEDGQLASEILDRQRVDLLITDIRMPHVDGLELIAYARKRYPAVHCVLLSAYSQFDYAREAIKLGVENYLLKPINAVELEETIDKALDNLFLNRKSSERLFYDNIVIRWLKNAISPEELGERSVLLGINLYLSGYCAVNIIKKDEHALVNPYSFALKEALAGQYEVYFCWYPPDYHVLIIGGAQVDTGEIARVARKVSEAFPDTARLAMAIGPAVSSSEQVPLSFQSACRQLDMTARKPCFELLTDTPIAGGANEETANWMERVYQISENDARQREVTRGLSALCGKNDNWALLMSKINDGILLCFDRQFQHKRDRRIQLLTHMYQDIAAESREEFLANAADNIDYSYLMYQHMMNDLSPVIHLAINYVHANYADVISIKDFCAKNKISMPYFGHLFKTETGVFFNSYVAQYRICMALEMLRATDRKISDIAEKVGFSSTSYFISCFKKQTGQTPIKYRSNAAN